MKFGDNTKFKYVTALHFMGVAKDSPFPSPQITEERESQQKYT